MRQAGHRPGRKEQDTMKYGKDRAITYLREMREALGDKLINPTGFYYGRERHLQLAREIGAALPDFDASGQYEILHGSYSAIYVAACALKPLLSAAEWVQEMRRGMDRRIID